MSADLNQRKNSLDPTQSFIVQAPAGSGKTELLIQRYLKLLPYVQYPEQILAMTFTRKAAGEMKTRILKALIQAQSQTIPQMEHAQVTYHLSKKVLKRNQEAGWNILETPSRLKIQTIDSFCAGLTQQTPIFSGLGTPEKIEENPRIYYEKTARRILSKIEEDGPIADATRMVLMHLDNSKSSFIKKIADLLKNRDQWFIPFFDPFIITDESKSYLEGILKSIVEENLQCIEKLVPIFAKTSLPKLAAFSASQLTQINPDHIMSVLRNLGIIPGSEASYLKNWRAIAWLLTTDKGELRKPGGVNIRIGFPSNGTALEESIKKEFKEFLISLESCHEFTEHLKKVKNLPDPFFSNQEWILLKSILILLPEMESALRKVFHERQTTDFTEISLSALKALGQNENPSDLLFKLDYKIQHILVDEYQDTSFKQFELLSHITSGWTPGDGRTLFLVGDPMQSIYRFRDAQVGLFLLTRDEGIGSVQLKFLTLQSNFRSQLKLVEWVNSCFSKIFPQVENPTMGLIKFTRSKAILNGLKVPPVTIESIFDPEGKEESEKIVQKIQVLRKVSPNDTIAILVRAKGHLTQILNGLKESGVAIRAEEIYSLSTQPDILDLTALIKALLDQKDRLAWLSVIRAPWCGVSLRDIHTLCSEGNEANIWDLLNNSARIKNLSPDGQQRIQRFNMVINKALSIASTVSIRKLVEGCWHALGGPFCLQKISLKDAEIFFEHIQVMSESGQIQWLRQFEKNLEDLYTVPDSSGENPVHVMTMHKAKGLEFDHVLLPGLGKKPRVQEHRLLHWLPYGKKLLIAPVHEKGDKNYEIYDYLLSLDRKKESQEILRLLYVACTRAKKQIHLFGHVPYKKGEWKPSSNSLLKVLWPFLQKDWPQKLDENTDDEKYKSKENDKPITIRRLPLDFVFPIEGNCKNFFEAEIPENNEIRPEFIWAGNHARALGKVLHRVFQDIIQKGVGEWNKLEQCKHRLITALLAEGLSDQQLKHAVEKGIRGIENMLDHQKGQWIFQDHLEQKVEYPVSGLIGSHIEDRVIDRTFVDKDNIRWIIDFKTGEHQGSDLEGFFSDEVERYQGQLKTYELLLKNMGETRQIKKALYYPMHQRFIQIP